MICFTFLPDNVPSCMQLKGGGGGGGGDGDDTDDDEVDYDEYYENKFHMSCRHHAVLHAAESW